jgi:prepilin-type N-terminal cleavage/methylation domain-containing protein/prepilin-type processing-associated H-X9-DG protein
MTGRSKGFTLIELLVVIAIIALLLTLVVPTVRDALERARTAACSSQLRQVGVALFTYASTHHTLPPPAGHVDGGLPTPSFWYSSLGPYLGLDWDQGSGPTPGQLAFGNTGLSCPAYGGKRLGYAYNEFLPPSHRSLWVPKVTPAKWMMDRATRPSERLLVGDATMWFTGGPDLITYSETSHLDWFRHGEGANLLFLDGHVQRHDKIFITDNRLTLFFFDVLP